MDEQRMSVAISRSSKKRIGLLLRGGAHHNITGDQGIPSQGKLSCPQVVMYFRLFW